MLQRLQHLQHWSEIVYYETISTKYRGVIMTKDQIGAVKEFMEHIQIKQYGSLTYKEKMQYLFLLQVSISYIHGPEDITIDSPRVTPEDVHIFCECLLH